MFNQAHFENPRNNPLKIYTIYFWFKYRLLCICCADMVMNMGVGVHRAFRLNPCLYKMTTVIWFKLIFIYWDRFALFKNKQIFT